MTECNNRIKVMSVNDLAVVRKALRSILESDSSIEVVGTAADPYAAAQKLRKVMPDVITLDIEMPRMDGQAVLKRMREIERDMGIEERDQTLVIMIATLEDPKNVVEAY